MKDYYQILGLDRNATKEQIKSAFRKLSLKIHPDVNEGDTFFSELFKNINEAHEVLSDDVKRAEYDNQFFGELLNENKRKDEQNRKEAEELVNRKLAEEKARERELQRKKLQQEQIAKAAKISAVGKIMEETYVPRRTDAKKSSFPWFTLVFMAAVAVFAIKMYSKPAPVPPPVIQKPAAKKKPLAKKNEFTEEERKLNEEMQKRYRQSKPNPVDSEATNTNSDN